ncbi:hypothetical protein ACVWWD_001666 [Mesorhizobium sp. URHB0026]
MPGHTKRIMATAGATGFRLQAFVQVSHVFRVIGVTSRG